jgi:hypothetical protein
LLTGSRISQAGLNLLDVSFSFLYREEESQERLVVSDEMTIAKVLLATVILTMSFGNIYPNLLEISTLTTTPIGTQITVTNPATMVGVNLPVVGEAAPDRQQVEPTIAIDPRNPSIIAAGAQDLRLRAAGQHRWHGLYRSTDGGQTWTDSLLPGFLGDTSPQGLASPLHKSNATSDAVLAFDTNGNLYYTGLALNITSTGIVTNTALFVAKFTNDASTYSITTLVSAGLFPDKPWIAVDTTGGPNDGNVYVAYDANLTATQHFATLFTRSTDGGQTFSPPFYAPADQTGELSGVTVDPSGNIYVSAVAFDPVTGNPLNYIEVSKITNAGTVLTGTSKAVNPAFAISSPLPGGSFRTFTIPQIASDPNGVYVVFDDFRTGNSQVYFTRSTDGGTTWSTPLAINDVTTGQHFFPTIAVSSGIISMAWYDSRLNTGTTITSLDIFYSQSTNSGASFSPNLRVTSVSFNPELVLRTDAPSIYFPFIGDYIQIAAGPNSVHPIWADNRNACDTVDPTFGCVDQDAFTATISTVPNFSISASPSSQTLPKDSVGAITITATSFNRFSGMVNINATISPLKKAPVLSSPVGITISPTSPTGTSTLTVSTLHKTASGTYTITITGFSGSLVHSVIVMVTVSK